jgi:hypothetical protein
MSAGDGRHSNREPLDAAAFDHAEAAWHERYIRTFSAAAGHGDAEQAHHEAIGEALEEFLGVYERERRR